MPKRLGEKNKPKHTVVVVVVSEGKWLEPVTKVDMSLSLMVRLKETGLSLLIEEDTVEELFVLNIQVKNEVIDTINDTVS